MKLFVIEAIRNTVVDVAPWPPDSASRPSSTTPHVSASLPQACRAGRAASPGSRSRLGSSRLEIEDVVGEPPQLRAPAVGLVGRRRRADDQLGEAGVDPAGNLLTQRW